MTTRYWIYETDEAGNGHRCHFDGEDWHVLVVCPDGNSAASSAPFRTDAVTKARLKLGLPVMATISPASGEWSADEAALQPAQIAAMAGGAACRNDAIPDPVAILHRAIHERNAALRRFGDRVLPPWEWVLSGGAVAAFAVVAWVYAP